MPSDRTNTNDKDAEGGDAPIARAELPTTATATTEAIASVGHVGNGKEGSAVGLGGGGVHDSEQARKLLGVRSVDEKVSTAPIPARFFGESVDWRPTGSRTGGTRTTPRNDHGPWLLLLPRRWRWRRHEQPSQPPRAGDAASKWKGLARLRERRVRRDLINDDDDDDDDGWEDNDWTGSSNRVPLPASSNVLPSGPWVADPVVPSSLSSSNRQVDSRSQEEARKLLGVHETTGMAPISPDHLDHLSRSVQRGPQVEEPLGFTTTATTATTRPSPHATASLVPQQHDGGRSPETAGGFGATMPGWRRPPFKLLCW